MKIDKKLRHASHTTIFSLLRSVITGFTSGQGSAPGSRKQITRNFAPICGAAIPRPYPVVFRQYASVSARSSTSARISGAAGFSTRFATSRNPGSPNCKIVRIAISVFLFLRLVFFALPSPLFSAFSVHAALKYLTVFPTSPIPPRGRPPQSLPCSQSHPRAAPVRRSLPGSPAKTHPPAPYTDRKPESSPFESLRPIHRVHHL